MILDGGTTNVSSAGTRVQISNTVNKVRWIRVKALAGNSGLVYFGTSDVSASNGYELAATNTNEISFEESLKRDLLSLLFLLQEIILCHSDQNHTHGNNEQF